MANGARTGTHDLSSFVSAALGLALDHACRPTHQNTASYGLLNFCFLQDFRDFGVRDHGLRVGRAQSSHLDIKL